MPWRTSLQPQRVGAGLLWLAPAVVVLVGGWLKRWTDEDAYINLRVVDQLLAGNGPVFNAGQRVEAFTSPLWLGIVAVIRLTLGQVVPVEWALVGVTLALTGTAFVVGARATRALHGDVAVLPLGLLVAAAVPVVWEFATSGLEMALVWAWIAGCWAVLVRLGTSGDRPTGRRRVGALVLLGLGPVIRPDLAVMSLCFLLAWLALVRPRPARGLGDLSVAAAAAVGYQVFRMGYYAALVPSTALAKDADGLHLDQGVDYLLDLSGTYRLWVPVLVVLAVLVTTWWAAAPGPRVAGSAMAAAAVLHAAYVVGIGGDYMHGRLLLPALFALVVPVGLTWPTGPERPRRALTVGAGAVVICWVVLCAGFLRYQNPEGFLPPISNRRDAAPLPHVRPAERQLGPLTGAELAAAHRRGERGTVTVLGDHIDPTGDPSRLVVVMGSIGLSGYRAGTDVHVVDIGGLAEPIVARSAPVPGRPAGHRKGGVHLEWYAARHGVVLADGDPARVAAAERALGCGPLADLLADIEQPLTVSRFFGNVADSVANTALEVDADPLVAVADLCDAG